MNLLSICAIHVKGYKIDYSPIGNEWQIPEDLKEYLDKEMYEK